MLKNDWTILWIKWIHELKEFGRPSEGLQEEHPTSDGGDDLGPERVERRSGVAHRGFDGILQKRHVIGRPDASDDPS